VGAHLGAKGVVQASSRPGSIRTGDSNCSRFMELSALRCTHNQRVPQLELIMKLAMKSMLLSMLFMFGVAGCNTMHGAGEDIERGGEAIQRQAN